MLLIWMYSFLFQDSTSPLMNYISSFHDYSMMLMIMIISSVMYILFFFSMSFSFGRFFKSSEMLEGVWTVIPCIILILLATPSLMTLYLSDEVFSPITMIKIIGHQWYWSYEYEGSNGYSFDSYMILSNELNNGKFRLLEVDNSVLLPFSEEVRLTVSSTDVIHSWTIPSMGVKMDAIPGRINQFFISPMKMGEMYGQCSEICGSLHSFMPIKVEVIKFKDFVKLF